MSSLVEVRNLSFRYPRTERWILSNVNLEIHRGELALLMGPSGCGKTTLALCLRGIIPSTIPGELRGSIRVAGKDVTDYSPHQLAEDISVVFQDPDDQVCCMTVMDDVAFGLENLMVHRDVIRERVDVALDVTGMSRLRNKEVYLLSGGQKQRVAIASGIAMSPKLLILDNPTANLDPIGTREVMSTIDRLREKFDMTMLVIEQKVDELIDKADRVILMNREGSIEFVGDPREIMETYGKEIVERLGLRIGQCSEIAMLLREKGLRVRPYPVKDEEVIRTLLELKREQVLLFKGGKYPVPRRVEPEPSRQVVQVREVFFAYPDGTEVLRGVNLSVEKGDFLAIIGPNGSGKTTLCLNLLGIYKPNRGEINIAGLNTKETPLSILAEKIGYAFQEPERQFVSTTVYDEIAFGLRIRGFSREEVDARVREMVDAFLLTGYEDVHPFRLSMGEKRRLSVASILVLKPDIFILDEPVTGLDLMNLRVLMGILEKFNKRGCTILIVTHDMTLVAEYTRSVCLVHNGIITFHGSTREFFGEYEPEEETGITFPPVCRISRRMAADGISPYTLTPSEFTDQIEVSGG
jgi:energy-coupling factor transport system ATP-binding protein